MFLGEITANERFSEKQQLFEKSEFCVLLFKVSCILVLINHYTF